MSAKAVFGFIAGASKAIKTGRDAAMAAGDFFQHLKNYNSQNDVEFQKSNPLPPPEAPDWQQILAYSGRAFALGLELVEEIGNWAERKQSEAKK